MKTCCVCGLRYEDFRTGYTYRDIYEMLWSGNGDPRTWKYKRRHTVLGLWHMLKTRMWEAHLAECEYYMPELPFEEDACGAVPF